jgi:hypothetical protein
VALTSKVKETNALSEQFTEAENSSYYYGHWKSTPQSIYITSNSKDDVMYVNHQMNKANPEDFQLALKQTAGCGKLHNFELNELESEAIVVLHSFFNKTEYYMVAQITYEVASTQEKLVCSFSMGKGNFETVAAQVSGFEYLYLGDQGFSIKASEIQNASFDLEFGQF